MRIVTTIAFNHLYQNCIGRLIKVEEVVLFFIILLRERTKEEWHERNAHQTWLLREGADSFLFLVRKKTTRYFWNSREKCGKLPGVPFS